MQITFTVDTAGPDIREAVDTLLALAGGLVPVEMYEEPEAEEPEAKKRKVEEPEAKKRKVEEPEAKKRKAEEPKAKKRKAEEQPAVEGPVHTRQEVREALKGYGAIEGRDAAIAILHDVGHAKSVTELSEEMFDAVFEAASLDEDD